MNILTAAQAADLIQPGWTVACAGFVGAGHAEAVTSALERRFEATRAPRDLTLVYSAGQGDRARRGVNHFGHAGLVRTVVGGHWRSATRLIDLALQEQCEGFNLPQGVISHLYRAIGGGKPGLLTKIGLHTFVDPRSDIDPRYVGGAVNQRALDALRAGGLRWVEHERFRGEDWLFYPRFTIHCALLRATAADTRGNLSAHEEAFHHELLAIAQAAHNSGGIVIAQVRELVEHHQSLADIRVPGLLVDHVVVCEDPADHQMTFGEAFNPAYVTAWRGARFTPDTAPADEASAAPTRAAPAQGDGSQPAAVEARLIVQRRAVLELARRQPRVVNLGVGMPAAVGDMAHRAGLHGFTLTVEAGPVGGIPADGLSFGASAYPEAVIDQPAQFDFYEGGGIDLAILGLAELDGAGNVNVSKFGEGDQALIAGVGGFINITQSAKAVVFMGTLTAGGLRVAVQDGQLHIVQEGRLQKIVPQVAHLSFNGRYVAGMGTDVLYITERAVFAMRPGTGGEPVLTLVEIAPGLDVHRDVLAHCGAPVAVAPDVRSMDARIFTALDDSTAWLRD